MMKVIVDYPTPDEEREIMRRNLNDQIHEKVKAVIHPQDILKARNAVSKVYMDERIENILSN